VVVSVTAGRWLAGGTAQPRRTAKLPGASRARAVWGWLAHGHGFGLRVSRASRVGDEDERVARIGLPGVPTSTWFAAGTRRRAGDYAAARGSSSTGVGTWNPTWPGPSTTRAWISESDTSSGAGGAWALAERILCVCVCVFRERGQEIFSCLLYCWSGTSTDVLYEHPTAHVSCSWIATTVVWNVSRAHLVHTPSILIPRSWTSEHLNFVFASIASHMYLDPFSIRIH
jgi:hypothetical protein